MWTFMHEDLAELEFSITEVVWNKNNLVPTESLGKMVYVLQSLGKSESFWIAELLSKSIFFLHAF